MKLNWGFRIAATYILFIIGVLVMVVIFMNQDVELVTENYYAKELTYQNEIDKKNRTNALSDQLEIKKEDDSLLIMFPKQFNAAGISGLIYFYRPSDESRDFVMSIKADSSGIQSIPSNKLIRGLWKIKVEWEVGSESYINEKILMAD
jgi:hypothetical protein